MEPKKRKSSGILDTIKTLFYAVIIALIIRAVAYEPFNIPSGSMKPTLLVGDYLFVSKYSYGYSRYSFPLGLDIFEGRILYKQPKRGDVVVFKLPADNSTDYIKRLIGLPGDVIRVFKGEVYINNKKVPRKLMKKIETTNFYGQKILISQYKETLPNGVSYEVYDSDNNSFADNTREFIIKDNHFFMMGDNRDDSQDSRFSQVGQIPKQNLVGRAEILFFSLDGIKIRFKRLLNLID
ncbi:signal peptidase I [Alphaproteobacteria bacterium]|nr:signal peptidase I [Alphaproteobacteria bacterium]